MDRSTATLSKVTHFMKYSKHIKEVSRREIWEEAVQRNKELHIKRYPFLKEEIEEVYENFIKTKKVLPSMRSMQFAGPAIELNHARIYNCCYLPIDSWKAFPEIMFLLLGGTGVGYSVQYEHINKLPSINKPTKRRRFVISDDIIGWSEAVKALIRAYLDGQYFPEFEYGDIRKKGTILKTSGGRAPGPGPLKTCLEKIHKLLDEKENGDKLTSLECHDIACFIADAILAGGIREAAMIALFNINDESMIKCKSDFKVQILDEKPMGDGFQVKVETTWNNKEYDIVVSATDYPKFKKEKRIPWWYFEPQRARSNNSAVFIRHKAKKADFMKFWKMVESNKTGEPGIYWSNNLHWGANPCVEIALRPFQFCNLTEIDMNTVESQEDFEQRVRAAAFIGTLQAGFIDFHYLRGIWKETTERDSLLGVSLTGICGSEYEKFDYGSAVQGAIEENARIAERVGVKPAARVTCIKPAGSTSLILGCSSGIHAWHAKYFKRRMKVPKLNPIYKYLKSTLPEFMEDSLSDPENLAYIVIPTKAPEGSVVGGEEEALEFLERVKFFSEKWIAPGHIKGDNSHNVSATVYVKDDEWDKVGKWMWENRKVYNGISVFPFDGGTYVQSPNEIITAKEYNTMIKKLRDIDLTKVIEQEDTTDLANELACAGGICEFS